MNLPVMRYETWIRGRELIDGGADDLGKLLEGVNFELPGLGLVLHLAAEALGWGLSQLWDAYPHENEPRSKKFAWASLHAPGHKFYVQDPRWRSERTEELLSTIRHLPHDRLPGVALEYTLNKLPPAPLSKPDAPLIIPRPIQYPEVGLLRHKSRAWHARERRRRFVKQKIHVRDRVVNPTFGKAGF
jgi:hypothetical protein